MPRPTLPGRAALFIAKAYKIHQRVHEANAKRLQNKDAGDVLRLMMAESGDPRIVADRIRELLADVRIASVTRTGLQYLRELFGTPAATGTQMAVQALAGGTDPVTIEALAPAYVADLDGLLTS